MKFNKILLAWSSVAFFCCYGVNAALATKNENNNSQSQEQTQNANGGHGGQGGTATGGNVGDIQVGGSEGGIGYGGSSSSSSNSQSSSDNSLENVGNASVSGSGNSRSSQQTIITYPMTLPQTALGVQSQCDSIYETYQGLHLKHKGVGILFVTRQYKDAISIFMEKSTLLGDGSSRGLPSVASRFFSSRGRYLEPVKLAKNNVRKSPKGTKTIVAYISTNCHTISMGLNGGVGQVNSQGITQLLGGSIGGATTIPFAELKFLYFSDELVIDDCAIRESCTVTGGN